MLINGENRDGAFILREADGYGSRDNCVIASGQRLVAGTVLTLGDDGKYTAYTGDTTKTAAILFRSVDATNGDVKALIIRRKAEVNAAMLTWPDGFGAQQISNASAVLARSGIEVR